MSSKSNFSYKSLIKVHGCPLLPPVIDSKLRKEIIKHREDAIAVEQELSLKKITESERLSEKSSCISDDALNQCIELDGCSEGTIKLIEYIKKALKDVAHDSNVEKLQTQFFDDLKKFEIEKIKSQDHSFALSSSDTLQNIETINTEIEEDKIVKHDDSDTSSDAETLSPENPNHNVNSDDLESNMKTPTRRRSFTLESPSPALVRYFQQLNKDSNSEAEDLSCNKTSKNLNEVWKSDSKYLDMCSMVLNSSDIPGDQQFERIKNISNNINNITGNDIGHNRSSNSLLYSPEKVSSSPLSSSPFASKIYSSIEEKAATKIQAGIRGYLIRRLLRTNKVIDLKKIICDSVVCAKKLHMEESVTQADVTLHVRLIRQVTAACFEVHNIFFEWPVKEQMALIRQDRIMAIKALVRSRLSSSDLMSKSDMKVPVTRQLISPRSGNSLHGSIMSASYPQDRASPAFVRLSKGCPTPS